MAANQSLRLFVFLALATYISGIHVECGDFLDATYVVIGQQYTCFATLGSVDNSTTNFNSVSGNHYSDGRNNLDVTAFSVEFNVDFSFFPRGIEQFFPNLRVLRLYVF